MSKQTKSGFDAVEEAIAEIGKGNLVIVTDDEARENEGDLVMAASKVTPESINQMILSSNQQPIHSQRLPLSKHCQPLNSVKIANHPTQQRLQTPKLSKDCQPLNSIQLRLPTTQFNSIKIANHSRSINSYPQINNAVQKFSQYNFQKTEDVKPPSEKLEDRKHEANLV